MLRELNKSMKSNHRPAYVLPEVFSGDSLSKTLARWTAALHGGK